MMLSKTAVAIFNSAVKSVSAVEIIPQSIILKNDVLSIKSASYSLKKYKRVLVVGAGKASAQMAVALESVLGKFITSGVVITKYGHSAVSKKIKILEAGHPVPDENTLKHSREVLEITESAGENDLVICLISGGGSSLFEVLPDAITLDQLQNLNTVLLKCGADISEINTLRKKISLVKGGGLLNSIFPAECLTLIISDVLGDKLQDIASGPTVFQEDALHNEHVLNIIQKYNLKHYLEPEVYVKLLSPTQKSAENSKHYKERVKNFIIANNQTALNSAYSKAVELGFDSSIVLSNFHGEARDVAKLIVMKIKDVTEKQNKKICLLFGGESTVNVKGNGKGGRNMELALAALISLHDFKKPFVFLSAGTDGNDGTTDAAGALISSSSLAVLKKTELDPQEYLNNNDSYRFFEQIGGLLKTGPTGTNVMDVIIFLSE